MRLLVLLLLLTACVFEEAQVGPLEPRLRADRTVLTPGETLQATLMVGEMLDLAALEITPETPAGVSITWQRIDDALVLTINVSDEAEFGLQALNVTVRAGQREGVATLPLRVVGAAVQLEPAALDVAVGETGVLEVTTTVRGAEEVTYAVAYPTLLEVTREGDRLEVVPRAQCDPCEVEVTAEVEGQAVARAAAEVRTPLPASLTLTAEPRTLTLAPGEAEAVDLLIEKRPLEGPVSLSSSAPDGFTLVHTEETLDRRVPAVVSVPGDAEARAYVLELEARAGEVVAQEEIIVSVAP